jgi:hypothetical protein
VIGQMYHYRSARGEICWGWLFVGSALLYLTNPRTIGRRRVEHIISLKLDHTHWHMAEDCPYQS